MECNKDEALRAKELAEMRITAKDFSGAKKYAIKAQSLYPELDGITQMLATLDVYVASEVKINGENDFYSILGLNLAADGEIVKKQYRKMALILHPDKNKTVGAEGAFKFVSEAWSMLSDNSKRAAYDMRRNSSTTTASQHKSSGGRPQVPRANKNHSKSCTTNVVHNNSKSPTCSAAQNHSQSAIPNLVPNNRKSTSPNVVPKCTMSAASNAVPNHAKSSIPNVAPSHPKAATINVVPNHSKVASANVVHNLPKSSIAHSQSKSQTFWTACSSCKVQFEYLRIYLNNRLCCQNCRRIFVAVETGKVPANGSSPFVPGQFLPRKKRRENHECTKVTYMPAENTTFVARTVSGFPSGFMSEIPNVIFHWGPVYGTSGTVPSAHSSSTTSANIVHQASGNLKGTFQKTKAAARSKDVHKNLSGNAVPNMASGSTVVTDTVNVVSSADRPVKRMKVDTVISADQEVAHKAANSMKPEVRNAERNGSSREQGKSAQKERTNGKSCSMVPAFDARKMLMDKARSEIRKKLEEMKLRAAVAAHEKADAQHKVDDSAKDMNLEVPKGGPLDVHVNQSVSNEPKPVSINVPDPDFHDFDKDRLEECFKPKQIWALYDDDDGMPRLYALIRKVISLKPFQIYVSYLNAKSNNEFASINWVGSGFTKTCGNFKVGRCEVIDSVNVFSHVVGVEKTGRGSVQIFPKQGEIWAVYRNWSADWDENTPDEARHQYDMVEVLDNYTEELGACVVPLVKSVGFKTVFQRDITEDMVQRIPREEMFRFSHMVPSWLLKGEETNNLLNGCWDLDPAAMHVMTEEEEDKPVAEEPAER